MYENCGWVCLPYFSTTFIPLTMCILHYECFMISLFSIKIVCYIAENYPQHPHCRILSFLFFRVKKKKKILLNCCTSYILALTLHLASHLSRLSSLLILILMQKKNFFLLLAINDCENPFTNDSRGCCYYYMLARTPRCCMSVHDEDVVHFISI